MRVLIVGAGLAGARCAETLRAEGFDGQIALVGEEPVAPYERPALSKEFLAGTRERRRARAPPGRRAGPRRRSSSSPAPGSSGSSGRTALTDDGRACPGTRSWSPPGRPRARLAPGRHRLRTLADAAGLREALDSGARR